MPSRPPVRPRRDGGVALSRAAMADAVLASKMHVPAPRPGWVMRPELLAVLNDSGHARLVTVVAGTGYGKSVLLALWRADPGRTRPLAVLAADARDDDPVVFWSGITACLAATVPGPGWERVRRLLAQQMPDLAGLVPQALLSALAAAAPVTLAIDDLHRVANPDCHAQLSWLVAHLPQGCQLLVASRASPVMPVARLRAAGELVELGPGQLRLSRGQLGELIARVADAGLPGGVLDRLVEATEGWPAAVYLAARTLRTHPDPSTLLARLGAARGHVADLFAEEVTARLKDRQARALARSSVLDRFTAGLCREVTGMDLLAVPGAASDLFLVPLDEDGTWFRHHHLIQAVLRRRLEQDEPGLVPDLHRRAAAWLAGHDLPGEAIEHALAAGDAATATATALITSVYPLFLNTGRRDTIAGWLTRLGPSQVEASAPAAIAAAWTAAFGGDRAAASRWLTAAARRGGTDPLPDGARSAVSAIALIRALFGFDGFKDMAEAAALAVELEDDPAGPWFGAARLALGFVCYLSRQPRRAIAHLQEAIACQALMPMVHAAATALLSLCHGQLGHHHQAACHADTAAGLAAGFGLDQAPQASVVPVAQAAIAYREGDYPRARELLERSLAVRHRVPGISPWPTVDALLLYARTCAATGDHSAVQRIISEAEDLLGQLPDPASPLSAELDQLRPAARAPAPRPAGPIFLTQTEHALLRLLPAPMSLPEIARQRHVSINTVKTQARAIYRKLGAAGRHHAVAIAREQGLIPGDGHLGAPGRISAQHRPCS